VHSLFEVTVRNTCPHIPWTGWHTSEIDWAPGSLKFYLDGKEVGALTGKWAPDQPMSWILQNESALYGWEAPVYSSAQLNLAGIAVYSYQGNKS
jgi:beta-glucanase (GH16 family)